MRASARIALLAAGALLAMGPLPGSASAMGVPEVLARMDQRNPTLDSYRARVHVDVRMTSFPFLAPKLDGTSYYRRPDTYVVVFDSVPSYARGFQRIFDDVGNPDAWEKANDIVVAGDTSLDGRDTIVLRLTKKIHSDILDHSLAYVDLASFVLVRMEWYYTNGGKIVMTQQYRKQGQFWVLGQQHATIAIPYVRAVADATYGTYETNVPVEPGAKAQ